MIHYHINDVHMLIIEMKILDTFIFKIWSYLRSSMSSLNFALFSQVWTQKSVGLKASTISRGVHSSLGTCELVNLNNTSHSFSQYQFFQPWGTNCNKERLIAWIIYIRMTSQEPCYPRRFSVWSSSPAAKIAIIGTETPTDWACNRFKMKGKGIWLKTIYRNLCFQA